MIFKNLFSVFAFSFKAKIKHTKFLVITLVLSVLLMCTPLIGTKLYDIYTGEEITKTDILSVIVVDETEGIADYSKLNTLSPVYNNITYKTASSIEEGKKLLSPSSLIFWLREKEEEFSIKILYDTQSNISLNDAEKYGEFVSENSDAIFFQKHQLVGAELISLNSTFFSPYQSGEKPHSEFEKIFLLLLPVGVAIIIYFIIFSSGQSLSTDLNSDKNYNVWETISLSATPISIVSGKILSAVVAGSLQLVAWICAILVGIKLSSQVSIHSENLVSQTDIKFLASCIPLVVTGLFFYSSVSAFCSTALRKSTETDSTGLVFSLPLMISLLFKVAECMGAIKPVSALAFLPFSAPFLFSLNGANNISVSTAMLSITISISVSIVLILISSRFYNKK